MKRRLIHLSVIVIIFLFTVYAYPELMPGIQKKTLPVQNGNISVMDTVPGGISSYKVITDSLTNYIYEKIFKGGFEQGVYYGVAAHLMEPKHDMEQLMTYAKNWFTHNQLADSSEVIQLPILGKNHIILFKTSTAKKVK